MKDIKLLDKYAVQNYPDYLLSVSTLMKFQFSRYFQVQFNILSGSPGQQETIYFCIFKVTDQVREHHNGRNHLHYLQLQLVLNFLSKC